jgi:hypothetical protein
MSATRRDFIRMVGIGLASLMMANCIPRGRDDDSPRGLLRWVWLRLDWLAQESSGEPERGEAARAQLTADHRDALNGLVAAGEITTAVADQLQAAFAAATYHVYRSHAPITCYEPVIVDYMPASSEQLRLQAEILTQMGESGDLDPRTVDQAQAAIERDITFLSLPPEEIQQLYDQLIESGPPPSGFPTFDTLPLEISPQAVDAARFLIEVLTQP